MITKVTQNVLDMNVKPLTSGLDVNGDGTSKFSIDGTIIGANFPVAGDFTTVTATKVDSTTITSPVGKFDVIGTIGSNSVSFSNQLRSIHGTAEEPAISATGNTNTGIFWDVNNSSIKFSNDGNHTWSIEINGDLIPNEIRNIGSNTNRIQTLFASFIDIASGITASTPTATTEISGLVELSTGEEAYGDSSSVVLTPSSLKTGFMVNRVLSNDGGYQIMPSGTVMVWGRLKNISQGSYIVTMPLTLFSTDSATIMVNPWVADKPPGDSDDGHGGLIESSSQIKLWHRYDSAIDLSWVVLGIVSN